MGRHASRFRPTSTQTPEFPSPMERSKLPKLAFFAALLAAPHADYRPGATAAGGAAKKKGKKQP